MKFKPCSKIPCLILRHGNQKNSLKYNLYGDVDKGTGVLMCVCRGE